MFGRLHQPMSSFFNYYLDFSRVGELVAANRHRYSNQEIAVRGGIVAATVASGLLGAYLNNPEKSGWGDFTLAAASALLGFVVSHTVVIVPLIQKRMKRASECEKIINEIRETMDHAGFSPSKKADVNQHIQVIMNTTLSDDRHSHASQTWGNRQRLLRELQASLINEKSILKPVRFI